MDLEDKLIVVNKHQHHMNNKEYHQKDKSILQSDFEFNKISQYIGILPK